MFESSFECMDMYRARKNDLLRSSEVAGRSGKVNKHGLRNIKPGRLLSAALIVRNLIR